MSSTKLTRTTVWMSTKSLSNCGASGLRRNRNRQDKNDAAPDPYRDVGIGLLGVAFAFGLTVLTMAYAIGHISGGYLNHAVSVGLWAGGRFPARELVPYIAAQLIRAAPGAAILYFIASGAPGFSLDGGFASNGFAEHWAGHYSLAACFISEVATTFGFLFCDSRIDARARAGRVCANRDWTLPHADLPGEPSTSVNPARSTGPALFAGRGHWASCCFLAGAHTRSVRGGRRLAVAG